MDKLIFKAYKKAEIYFYTVFAIAVVVAFFAHYFKKEFPLLFKMSNEINTLTIIGTIMVLYLVFSVPFAFWIFNKKAKTFVLIADELERYKTYLNWIRVRMFLIAFNLIANIGLYFIIGAKSYFFAAAIGCVGMIFCKPNIKNMDIEFTPTNEIEE